MNGKIILFDASIFTVVRYSRPCLLWMSLKSFPGHGWLFKIKLTKPAELDGLMDEQAYELISK